MEIDLNHEVRGGEEEEDNKNASCCYAECEDGVLGSCGYNSSNASPPPSSSIYLELWHACAGPLTCLPKKGNVVVYFPQGHLEQAASASPFPPLEVDLPTLGLQPQIFCRVEDVQLLVRTLSFFAFCT